jgi:predicted nucleotidyltransferase component of viral defense system
MRGLLVLSRSELEKNGPPGFALGQKEKDYVQHWILSFLALGGFKGKFKGGTALQKAFGLPRYSEDLDFTLDGENPPSFESISVFLSSAGFQRASWKASETAVSLSAKARVAGPLYNRKALSEASVTLEFSKREKTILKPLLAAIRPPYPDIAPYSLLVTAKEEIAAEKIRAILTRESARDLYDLNFLVKQNALPTREVVDEKLVYYGKKYSFAEFKEKAGALRKEWKNELRAFVPQQPDFEVVFKETVKAVSGI